MVGGVTQCGMWLGWLLPISCSRTTPSTRTRTTMPTQPVMRTLICKVTHTHTYTHSPVHGASSALSDSATQLSGCQGHRTVSASACGLLCPLLQALPEGIRAVTQQLQMLGVDGMGVQERGGCGAGAVGSCLHLALPGVPYEASACVCTCMRACMCMCACT